MPAPAKQSEFLLLLRQPPGPPPPPEILGPIMARFAEWMKGLEAQSIVVATQGLEVTGKVVRGPCGAATVSDGPYAEGKEIVGGYVLLRVGDVGQALAAARGCPGLDYGMAVEVRAIKSHHAN
ncbi:MAG: hypothetical protein HY302_10500 [Opitutae bacterium]|nr:hypothetical protein [Opitutae bacterium]